MLSRELWAGGGIVQEFEVHFEITGCGVPMGYITVYRLYYHTMYVRRKP